MAPNPDNFLQEYMVQILEAHGFNKLSPEDQAGYLPQFMAEAERRLGLALMPELKSEGAVKEFSDLLRQNTTAEQWHAFWTKNVPNFTDKIKGTLEEYAKEVSAAFAM